MFPVSLFTSNQEMLAGTPAAEKADDWAGAGGFPAYLTGPGAQLAVKRNL